MTKLFPAFLSFFASSAIIAHLYLIKIHTSRIYMNTEPYAFMGQGIWCGIMAMAASVSIYAQNNAKRSKFLAAGSFIISMVGVLVDGQGLFILLVSRR